MRYALVNNSRAEATPSTPGICEHCSTPVVAKCGSINAWHWAHTSLEDCDSWAEPISEWHRAWQDLVPPENREVTIGNHRADIVTPDGVVVEIQHSSLAPADIKAREDHYGRMVWIYDAVDAYEADRFEFHDRRTYKTFRWKHARTSLKVARMPVFLDLGEGGVMKIRTLHMNKGTPTRGSYQMFTRADMAARFNYHAERIAA